MTKSLPPKLFPKNTYQARTHPPNFQNQHDSHSTSWKSQSGHSDDAERPARFHKKMTNKIIFVLKKYKDGNMLRRSEA